MLSFLRMQNGSLISRTTRDALKFTYNHFPGLELVFRCRQAAGAQVRWRRDGKELFYIAPNGELMAVSFDAARIGSPVPLFLSHVGALQDVSLSHYIPSLDGERFIMDTAVEETRRQSP